MLDHLDLRLCQALAAPDVGGRLRARQHGACEPRYPWETQGMVKVGVNGRP